MSNVTHFWIVACTVILTSISTTRAVPPAKTIESTTQITDPNSTSWLGPPTDVIGTIVDVSHEYDNSCVDSLGSSASGFSSNNVTLLSHVPLSEFPGNPFEAHDIWSYVSPSGREYAIIGLECSVGVVEVTDPMNPVVINTIPGPCSLWHDMKVHGEYAYNVIEQTGNGIQIIDLTDVDNGQISLANTSTLDGFFMTAHNIAYNPDSGFFYLGSTNRNGGAGITAVDATDPVNPVIAGEWIPSTGDRCHDLHVITYDSGIYAGREIAFCFAESAGFYVVDVTDKQNMFQRSQQTYPTVAYCHQGWTTEDHKYLFIGDEGDEFTPDVSFTTTYIFKIEHLSNPRLTTTFNNGQTSLDHNLIIRGDRVYEANYSSGLRVYDISEPAIPQEVGFFDTFPENNGYAYVGAWGVDPHLPSGNLVVSDINRGLFVFRDDTAGPVARYKPSIGKPFVNQSVMFDGSLSMHPTPPHQIISYEWDFSYDGVTFIVEETGMMIPYTFTNVGLYTVALRVTDDDGVPQTNLIDKVFIVELGLFAPNPLSGELSDSKDRYVSFDATTNNTNEVATRVTRIGGTDKYVDCTSITDLGADGWIATLVNGPLPAPGDATYYCDLSGVTSGLHIRGCSIVPGNMYDVAMTTDGSTFSTALSIPTTPPQIGAGRPQGDTVGTFMGGGWSAPDGLVTGNDIVAIVQKFSLTPDAPILARVDTDGAVPNGIIAGNDILRAVNGFTGEPFGYGVTDCLTGTCVPPAGTCE